MAHLRRTAFVLLLLITLVTSCDKIPSPTAPTSTTTPVVESPVTPADFVGQVAIPINTDRHHNLPVPGVTVTIVAGSRAGEWVETDPAGRYTFLALDGDSLHLRLEKAEHETKEVIVHRARPTEVIGAGSLEYAGPQRTPGMVLMGLKWPVEIKTIMSQMPVVPDLLLIRFDPSVPVNMYQRGVVGMLYLDHLKIMAHEVCHAHQHAHIQPRGYIDWSTFWDGSPEGEAYLTARQADWGEVGKNEFDLWKWTSSPLEGAAETCASWWGTGIWQSSQYNRDRVWLIANAPHRARWAEEWLTKPLP